MGARQERQGGERDDSTLTRTDDSTKPARDLQDAMLARLTQTAPDPASFINFGLKRDALGVILKTDIPGDPTPTPTPDNGGPPSCPPGHARRDLC